MLVVFLRPAGARCPACPGRLCPLCGHTGPALRHLLTLDSDAARRKGRALHSAQPVRGSQPPRVQLWGGGLGPGDAWWMGHKSTSWLPVTRLFSLELLHGLLGTFWKRSPLSGQAGNVF